MKRLIGIFSGILALFSACIENDIPHPRIKAEILNITARGEENVTIDYTERTVLFNMADTVDLDNIFIERLELTEGVTIDPFLDSLMYVDLSVPAKYTLSLYQDYEWTISATQNIERTFAVENQTGAPVIDVVNKMAIAYVVEGTDLSSIVVTGLKLGPSDSQITPTVDKLTDFSRGAIQVVVSYRTTKEQWSLYVFESEETVYGLAASPWETVAWLHANGISGADNGFEIRKSGDADWEKVSDRLLEINGGVFSARVNNLVPGQTYEYRAYSNNDYTDVKSFTTGLTEQLPNSSFEEWHQPESPWLIFAEGGEKFWDSGNKGATSLRESDNTTVPDATIYADGTKSAKLQSRYVVVKFAAGNIFTGEYVKTEGSRGALLDFGRPFRKHPSKLTGWYKYQPGIIDWDQSHNTLPASLIAEGAALGKMDKGHIWIVLRDANEPIHIDNTNRPAGLYDYKTDPNLIAYGELIQHTATTGDGLVQFEIDLTYYHTDRVPTYIAIVASASKYGDYFMGSSESILWLDDFELVYD